MRLSLYDRHLLLTAGPQFTEELWYIVCKGIKQIVDSTLATVKELINCFNHGSTNVSGENGMIVKIVARRDTTPVENMRLMQIAEQVNFYTLKVVLLGFLVRCQFTAVLQINQRCSIQKSILKKFAKFTGKHLCQTFFFNKVAGHLS